MPFANEHAARQENPDKYAKFRRENGKFGAGIDAIWGIMDDGTTELQTIRFDAKKFTPAEAAAWCEKHGFKSAIEPASGDDSADASNADHSDVLVFTAFFASKDIGLVEVVGKNADGSGRVTIPILKVCELDLSKTAGGGTGKLDVTRQVLLEMAANFPAHPGPVPIGIYPHKTDRGGGSEGFLEALKVKGETLYGTFWLGPMLFAEVTGGIWRGFSVEAYRDKEHPSGKIEGWDIGGGVFTNQPAAPIEFRMPDKLAASAALQYTVGLHLAASDAEARARGKETEMAGDTVSLAVHESKVAELQAAVDMKARENSQLSTKLEAAQQTAGNLRIELTEAQTQLSTARAERETFRVQKDRAEAELKASRMETDRQANVIGELRTKLTEAEDTNLSREVREIVLHAIDPAGGKLPPALFDGYETNPAGWLRANYASLDAFKTRVSAMLGVAPMLKASAVKSGHEPGKGDPDAKPKDDRAVLTEDGKPNFANITSEEEAKKAREAALAAKAKN